MAARPGTASEPGNAGQPRSLRVQRYGAITILWWAWMGRVNGFPVTHFQVERNGITVATDVLENMYVDLQGDVNQAYRVRAVNEFGGAGPWSRAAGASGRLEQTGTAEVGAPTGVTATAGYGVGRIDLSWFAPSTDRGLRYHIEHSTDGASPWRILSSSHPGTTYPHTGLLPGTTHYYRVAAVKGSVISAWVYVQETTEGEEVVEQSGAVARVGHTVPGWPENLRFSSVDRTSVTLVWDPPVNDGGSPVTGYEYRVYGPCASGAAAVCDVVAPTRVRGTSRRITGLNREGDLRVPGAGAERRGRRGLVRVGDQGGGSRDRRRRAGHSESLAPDGARGRRGHLPVEAEPGADAAVVGDYALGRGR